jgi:putative ABC transport system permease protein
MGGIDRQAYIYVERGYQTPGSTQVLLWILFGMGGVLMLGGTLTATFLALSDARPDLATLSAVGASPRTRRGVAAAYALAVGAVGAVLGAAVGFIPGIAISYPLTRTFARVGPTHYLDIPWLQILALVVALPLLTALVVGLLARSRLPVVARLD